MNFKSPQRKNQTLTPTAKRYWLLKSEPGVYSIDHLAKDKKTDWECVRNYQARNFMLRDMQTGDEVLFYHSNAEPSGIAGLAKVNSGPKPDKTQFDKNSEYFDPKATQENPRWHCVEVSFVKKFASVITLDQLRKPKELAEMQVLKKGQRLSVQPVTEAEFRSILKISANS